MGKRCFLFEGQGAQVQGMGQEIYGAFKTARDVFDLGSEATGVSLQKLCFDTPSEELSQTKNAQLAIFTVSMSILSVLAENCIAPDIAAGFSLGECSALCAAGAYTLEEGFQIVQMRGQLMQACAEANHGAMYAVIGLDDAAVENICKDAGGYVIAANYNCPSQLVIAGDEASAEKAAQKCLESGAAKAVRLAVSGAFHTAHMAAAAEEFKTFLKGFDFKAPSVKVFSNASGKEQTDFSDLPEYLSKHIVSPVRWKDGISAIAAEGDVTFYEIGCGKTLTGFNRKIDRALTTISLSSAKSITEVV